MNDKIDGSTVEQNKGEESKVKPTATQWVAMGAVVALVAWIISDVWEYKVPVAQYFGLM